MDKNKKPIKLNPFVIIFYVVIVCGILTFLITPGTLENGVYTPLPKNELNFNNLFNIFRAIPYGIKDTANLVILILVVGGALEIYNRTGAIDAGISSLVTKFGKGSNNALLLALLIVVFSAIGGFLGWIETLIPFIPIVISFILALGYDSMTAVAVCIIGTMGGFVAGPTNLYTVGVCNGIIQKMGLLPEGSDVFVGLEYRVIIWAVITLVSVLYIMAYAIKVRKDPSKSLVADIDVSDIGLNAEKANSKLTTRHIFILLTIVVAMILTVIGMRTGFDGVTWGIDDVSSVFFLSGLLSGIIARMNATEISDAFIQGARGAISGAIIVGVARGVYWILNTANVNATIVYYAIEALKGTSPLVAGIGIIIIVTFLNGLIPSGSGKGVLLSPILVPIGLSLGLSPQSTVLAYQFGDGITNMFWFSYGTLLIFLNYGKVPIDRWYKFYVPLMGIFFILAFIFLAIALKIGF